MDLVEASGGAGVCVGGAAAGTGFDFLFGARRDGEEGGTDRLGGLAGMELRSAGSGKSKMTPHCSQRIFLRA